jgi:hypothetical protein
MLTGAGQTYDYAVTVPGNYSYYCIVHGRALMSATFTANGTAPVKLSSFSVAAQEKEKRCSIGKHSQKRMQNYFSIQRSINGKDFQEIGKVRATGNSTIPVNYSFVDATTDQTNRYYYYQLLTVDFDSREERSKIIMRKAGSK